MHNLSGQNWAPGPKNEKLQKKYPNRYKFQNISKIFKAYSLPQS